MHILNIFFLILQRLFFFFLNFDKREYPELFKYYTILSDICIVPYIPSYYLEEFFVSGPKRLY